MKLLVLSAYTGVLPLDLATMHKMTQNDTNLLVKVALSILAGVDKVEMMG